MPSPIAYVACTPVIALFRVTAVHAAVTAVHTVVARIALMTACVAMRRVGVT
jgi:hypothetical protein